MRHRCGQLLPIALSWIGASLALSPAAGSGPSEEVIRFRLEEGSVGFLHQPERGLTVSESCRTRDGRLDCEAYRVLSRVRMSLLAKPPAGGQEPGSLLCVALGGRVAMGVDAKKNENSFCRFRDGSIVDNGTIFHYARYVNDKSAGH